MRRPFTYAMFDSFCVYGLAKMHMVDIHIYRQEETHLPGTLSIYMKGDANIESVVSMKF